MATLPELKSSYLKDILNEEEYQSSVKTLKDWLTGQTQAATQQYQASAETAAQQASYDISGAYANYLKQQRGVMAQGQLESGHKEEIGGALQQQYQGAYSQARATQAQDVAKAQAQYAEDVGYASEVYEKSKSELEQAAEKEATLRAKLFRAAEQYTGLTDYKENITALGSKIKDESDAVIGTGKGIYDVDEQGYHTLTKYGTNVFREALLKDSGFTDYLEEKGLSDELEYYLSDAAGLHEKLFGFTETDYGVSEASKKAIAEATYGTKGYAETVKKPNVDDYTKGIDFWNTTDEKTLGKKLKTMSDDILKYASQIGLSEQEVNAALNVDNLDDYLDYVAQQSKREGSSRKRVIEDTVKSDLNAMYDRLLETSKKKYIKE